MRFRRILNIIGFCISLLAVLIAGVWMIQTWFDYNTITTFLTCLLAFIGCLIILIKGPELSRLVFRKLLIVTIILLASGIILLIYFYYASRVILKITEPHLNEQVHSPAKVSGFYRNISINQLIWIVPEDKKLGIFYLGDAVNVPKKGENNGTWDSVNVSIGAYDDGGKSFNIWAILVEQKSPAEDTIMKYQQNPYIPSPNSLPPVIRSTKITVIRQP